MHIPAAAANMDELRDMLLWLRPDGKFSEITDDTPLMEELDSCEGLALVAMVEARFGRTFGWEKQLHTVGDLLAYLQEYGIEMEEECK